MSNPLTVKRKDQILAAAMSVLIKNGYERSRMDDIVNLSGLSKGAIYWYYKSKKAIYLDLVSYWADRYSGLINTKTNKSISSAQQLRDLFDTFINEYEKDPEPFKALSEFWAVSQKDDSFNKKFQEVYSGFLELIETIVSQGVKSGEFKNLDVRITSISIMLNIEAINWFTLFDAHGVTAKQYINTTTDFILAGLLKKE